MDSPIDDISVKGVFGGFEEAVIARALLVQSDTDVVLLVVGTRLVQARYHVEEPLGQPGAGVYLLLGVISSGEVLVVG